MAYDMNDLNAAVVDVAAHRSAMFTDLTTVEQYAAVVPPAKVILGVPFYGYDWPTTDGTAHRARPPGRGQPLTYGQVLASGHPVYWDPVDPDRLDVVPGRHPVARDLLRRPHLPLALKAQLANSLPPRRRRHLGPRDGRQRPRHAGALMGSAPIVKGLKPGPKASAVTTTTTTSAPPSYSYSGTWDRPR